MSMSLGRFTGYTIIVGVLVGLTIVNAIIVGYMDPFALGIWIFMVFTFLMGATLGVGLEE